MLAHKEEPSADASKPRPSGLSSPSEQHVEGDDRSAPKSGDAQSKLPDLIAAFRSRKLRKRAAAVALVVGMGREAVPALLQALREGDPDVRKVAVVALGQIGPDASEAVPLLVEALADDWIAGAAAQALARIQGAPLSRR